MNFLKRMCQKIKEIKDRFVSWFKNLFGKYTSVAILATFLCFIAFISSEIAWVLFSWSILIAVYIVIFKVFWNLFAVNSTLATA